MKEKSNYGENATVKNPEIGDVWLNDGLILHIDKFSEDKFGKIIYCYDMNKKGYVTGCWYYLDIFVKNAKYIGHSKASIKDLFEADDTTSTDIIDRNIRKENMRLQAEINRLREALEKILHRCKSLGDTGDQHIACADVAQKALNGESEEK